MSPFELPTDARERADLFRNRYQAVRTELAKVIVGCLATSKKSLTVPGDSNELLHLFHAEPHAPPSGMMPPLALVGAA